MLEKEVERRVCEYAKGKGWLVFKFTSPQNRGVPDRIFVGCGVVLFIEFKRFGRRPTKLQQKNIDGINCRVRRGTAIVIDSVESGKALINKYEKRWL